MRLDRGITSVIIGIAIAFGQPEIAVTLTAQDVSNIAKQITVVISGPKLGSGVIIHQQGDTYSVLTNGHVVDEAGTYTVQTRDRSTYEVKSNLVQRLPGVDLAVLKFTSSKKYNIATIGNSDAATEGTTVYVSGAPEPVQGIEARTVLVLRGEIVGTNSQPQEGYVLIYNNNTHRGMSGGPVLDENGHLIGIHGRGARDNDGQKVGFNLGIPIKIFTASKTGSNLGVTTQNPPITQVPPKSFTDPSSNVPLIGRPRTIDGSEGTAGFGCPGRRC
ncbi:serine protease [Dendronalium sp. ChiSLP03b]|uniref:S1 family peptidase n=1 Tax=Dendronalium sp. ChiSLP03b TaxID=3075381 RepID=UPI002AD3E974|nr:serine protease [Dendronalium sp. ChiSLP03b]MDZ8205736.1 serine protease [Dendronalium sp. ChiSLP03b]